MAKSALAAALRDVKHIVAQTRGLVALEEELEKGVEMERMAKEVGARLEQLKVQEAGLEAKFAQAAADREKIIASARTEAEAIRTDGRSAVKAAAAEAARAARQQVEDERGKIIEAARAEGAQHLATAQTAAAATQARAAAALIQAREQAAAIADKASADAKASQQLAAEAEARRAEAAKEEAAARDRLASLKTEINSLKSRLFA